MSVARQFARDVAMARNTEWCPVTDWKARAEREAAAILDETGFVSTASRDVLVKLLGIAWLQGTNYGTHETLSLVEETFEEMRAEL